MIETSLYVKTAKTLNCARKQNEDKTNLHDEKMWVVDIKTNRAEQVLHPGVVGIDSIDEVLVSATDYNLTEREGQKFNFFKCKQYSCTWIPKLS